MREHPLATEPRRVGLPDVEDSNGVVDPAELEEHLEVIAAPPTDARLPPPECRCLAVGLAEPLLGRRCVSAPEGDEPQDRQVLGRVERELLLGQLESSLRMPAGELESAAMDRDEGDGKVVLRHLEAVLDRDVVGARGVRGRERPAPGPELNPGKTPERAGAPRLVALAPLLVLALEQGTRLVPPGGRGEGVHDCRHRLLHELLPADGGRELVRA